MYLARCTDVAWRETLPTPSKIDKILENLTLSCGRNALGVAPGLQRRETSMTWVLRKTGHEKFERNPLVAVVVQLRFHPVLKIADRIADFQDRVRARFPVFVEGTSELVSFKPPDQVHVRKEQQFSFRKEDEAASILLGVEALALENRRHTGHRSFLDDVKLAVESLVEIYRPINPQRLGMRYINIVDREQIGQDLGRDVAWTDLVDEEFLRIPAGLSDLEATQFSTEISSKVDEGALTLRYGILSDKDNRVHFRFDTDRYIDGLLEVETVMNRLHSFVDDIYAPFAAMVGPALREWMLVENETAPDAEKEA